MATQTKQASLLTHSPALAYVAYSCLYHDSLQQRQGQTRLAYESAYTAIHGWPEARSERRHLPRKALPREKRRGDDCAGHGS